jgi:NAD(P)-dependent dehydrogenase (short-subunit alcohol dehydrogenase family)
MQYDAGHEYRNRTAGRQGRGGHGGSSGIGAATVERFVAEGASVVFCDLPPGAGVELTGRIGAATARFHHTRRPTGGPNDGAVIAEHLGERAEFVPADVTVASDLEAVIARAIERFGHLDVLVNNAGIGGVEGSLVDLPEEVFDRMIAVNLKAVWLGMKAAVPHPTDGGSIVTTGSALALVGVPGMAAYVASKAAVNALTKTAAVKFAPRRIRVNAVAPGRIRTPITYDSPLRDHAVDPESLTEMFRAGQPLPVVGEPEYVASAIAWLASEESCFVTGQSITIDGGYTAQGVHLDFSGSGKLGAS